jgi:hypothetical protein
VWIIVGGLVVAAFEVAVKVFVWPDHQQLEGVFVQDAICQKAHQVAHSEFVYLDASQVANFGFSGLGLASHGAHRIVKRRLLGRVQLFDCPLKRRGDK